jgi:hypothetical protein
LAADRLGERARADKGLIAPAADGDIWTAPVGGREFLHYMLNLGLGLKIG